MAAPSQDLTRLTLGVLFIAGLIATTFWLLHPFLPAAVWAATLVLATWPLMLRVQNAAGGRRWVGVTVMTTVVLLVVFVPLWEAISVIVVNADHIGTMVQTVLSLRVPPPPYWLAGVPLIGAGLVTGWKDATAMGVEDLAPMLTPYAGDVTRWLMGAIGSLGETMIQFLLTVALAAMMYARGEVAAAAVIRFGRRLGGTRGETAVVLAGQAVRGVALGVVVTALVQSILGGIGMAVTGVPFPGVLTALMFMLCLAQIGPAPVLLPAVAWMYYDERSTAATILLVISVITLMLDNFLRPALIKRGADLPMLVILAGVIGGLMAIGLLGIFVGPALLAVSYALVNAWIAEGEAETAATR
jgi:predicted PurR-regulated permease PerM